ncbi:hypothetical protein [Streptomyces sp. FH025]|uniref:hypothetical protein n=1 Tax=Streptomyces sp. FH025 TaxID=2815937 RepID=UPI001A9E1266|nr:hypothetical protein [Streptomyces sp. FH025]MBO1413021.1 hypothetical protein [Streptomyces sp. FH025]
MKGPTEIAGVRTHEAGGHSFVFYPDADNPARAPGRASVFHWMPGRLHLGRTSTGYGFRFTRYPRRDIDDQEVCGILRFTLAPDPSEAAVDDALRAFLLSCPKDDPYWGWTSYNRDDFVPLTFQYTHTTLSNIAARADRTARTLAGITPWYCETQGATSGPMSSTDARTYTTLMGRIHTQWLEEAIVDGTAPLTVNRSLGIEFTAPVRRLTAQGDWRAIRSGLLATAKESGTGTLLTLDALSQAVGRLRADGLLTMDSVTDDTVPAKGPYRSRLLDHTGCADAYFLELARGAVLDGPPVTGTALTGPADGPPNPWGPNWQVSADDPPKPALAHTSEGGYRYLRSLTLDTRFTAEFDEIRREPSTYFFNVYPDDERHDLTRVFRPVHVLDNPGLEALAVSCWYPDETGKFTLHSWSCLRPGPPQEDPPPWYFTTKWVPYESVKEIPAGMEDWTPNTTYARRMIRVGHPPTVNTELFVLSRSDDWNLYIDPVSNGRPFDDIAIDVSPAMLSHLDVHPIRLLPGLRAGESAEVWFATAEDTHTAGFAWPDRDDDRPRRWMVFPPNGAKLSGRFRYRTTVHDGGGAVRTGPWIERRGSGALYVRIPRPTG